MRHALRLLLVACCLAGLSGLNQAAVTATKTPGPWDLYKGSSIVKRGNISEDVCADAAKAIGKAAAYTCRTRTGVVVLVTVDPPSAACAAGAKNWTVGTASCTAQYAGGASGTSSAVADTVAPDTGTAAVTCLAGVASLVNPTCATAAPPPTEPGFPLAWDAVTPPTATAPPTTPGTVSLASLDATTWLATVSGQTQWRINVMSQPSATPGYDWTQRTLIGALPPGTVQFKVAKQSGAWLIIGAMNSMGYAPGVSPPMPLFDSVPPPPVDVCPNIAGDQATIPAGMVKDAAGNCVTPPPPTDVCPNIEGVQASVPAGMVIDASGNCVTAPPPPPPSGALGLTACVPGNGTDYQVGDGKQYASLDAVPWESLSAGATVRIFYRSAPYTSKFVIAAKGTAAAPVRVCGVRGPNGERPVIDGSGATTRSAMAANYGGASAQAINEARSLIMIKQAATDDWNTGQPSYIQIDGLNIKRGHPNYSFKNAAGATTAYSAFGACIWVDRGNHIDIVDNEISDCSMAVFSKSVDGGPAEISRNLRIAGNYMWGHGIVGDNHQHTTYTQSVPTIIEFNRYGQLRAGAQGNGPKDRSAGTVVRYNRIEGGAHAIDLVEAQDYPAYALSDPAYRTTYVYGNQIVKTGGSGSFIHYGGDTPGSTPGANWGDPIYRKGTLYFFHNTVYVTDSGSEMFQLDTTDEHAEVWNNIFVYDPSTPAGQRAMRAQRDVGAAWVNGGILNLGRNWITSGWTDSDQYHPVQGQLNGSANMIVGTAAPIDLNSFEPLAGSAVVDAAVTGPVSVPVLWQLDANRAPAARTVQGAGIDLGAVERGGSTPPPTPAACAAQALTWTQGAASCNATYAGGASGTTAALADTTAPTTGSATASCTNGAVTVASALCATAPPPSSGLTLVSSLRASVPFAQQSGTVQYGASGGVNVSSVSDAIGGGITGPGSINGSNVRFGKVLIEGVPAIVNSAASGDPGWNGGPPRTDVVMGGTNQAGEGETVCFGIEQMVPPSLFGNAYFVPWDMHGSPDGGWSGKFASGSQAYMFQIIRNSGGDYTNYEFGPGGIPRPGGGAWVVGGQFHKFVTIAKLSTTAGQARTRHWIDGVLAVDSNEANAAGYYQYMKAPAAYQPPAQVFTRAVVMAKDPNCTEPQIREALAN